MDHRTATATLQSLTQKLASQSPPFGATVDLLEQMYGCINACAPDVAPGLIEKFYLPATLAAGRRFGMAAYALDSEGNPIASLGHSANLTVDGTGGLQSDTAPSEFKMAMATMRQSFTSEMRTILAQQVEFTRGACETMEFSPFDYWSMMHEGQLSNIKALTEDAEESPTLGNPSKQLALALLTDLAAESYLIVEQAKGKEAAERALTQSPFNG